MEDHSILLIIRSHENDIQIEKHFIPELARFREDLVQILRSMMDKGQTRITDSELNSITTKLVELHENNLPA